MRGIRASNSGLDNPWLIAYNAHVSRDFSSSRREDIYGETTIFFFRKNQVQKMQVR
jgi:hypothetical protein